ncbi:MAG: hypothetical protein AVDCRST_MAG61-359 [uncultured Friedmanniella sp.]|uniref:VOC domain-containing protein n=1 Tax=uncultured Friedmanniella sp. TaxID=335381 RepID=A0A6J4K0U3_9ACTN|nr:VOC family protein [uncultured Friedmanniella sp.]CAA9292178.1 MAG: hypothetical protein AVDCRST_MAG61-359 [uncultured Friedmanniella sp.]
MTGWLHVVLAVPGAGPTARFWSAALGWSLGEPWPGHPERRSFVPPHGDPYVHLQQIGSEPTAHLELEVAELDAAAARMVALGAEPAPQTPEGPTLRSPGGLTFRLVPQHPRRRPDPVTGPSGSRRRLVQVCLDLPPQHVDAEVTFWRAALPWREVGLDGPEFLGRLVPPTGEPLQVLLQQLGPDDGGRTTRLHLDLGSDDVDADVALVTSLGAEELHRGDGFVALRDPAGAAFCVTANAPDAP